MNTQEKQKLAGKLGKQIIELQKIKEALEKPEPNTKISAPLEKPQLPSSRPTAEQLAEKMRSNEASKKGTNHW